MGQYFPSFKAYDVRGKVPSELNPDLAYRIGRAYADETGAKTVCVGYDIRPTGPQLAGELTRGLIEAGVNVVDLGMVGTEMVYFATAFYGYDGGAMITASHNPADYNGIKLVRQGSRPISGDTGLGSIEKRTFENKFERTGSGSVVRQNSYADFIDHLLKLVPATELKPLRILASPGNGAAGVALDELLPHLPLRVDPMQWQPDGTFPNGVPNPILEESRAGMVARMRAAKAQSGPGADPVFAGPFGGPASLAGASDSNPVSAPASSGARYDFGVAWDGDYDRCFFLDEDGGFIEGYYIVGLLAQAVLRANPNQTIVYDPRLVWNTLDIVSRLGGKAVICKSGHAFIKEKMRAVDATYGGEMSAHHYFKDFWYCDSGMIPFLMVAHLVSVSGRSLKDLVQEMIKNYPCSGEINSSVPDVKAALLRVEQAYPNGKVERIDGLSIEFAEWRFNLRGSNTEPVIRLNVESRGNPALVREKTDELLALIRQTA